MFRVEFDSPESFTAQDEVDALLNRANMIILRVCGMKSQRRSGYKIGTELDRANILDLKTGSVAAERTEEQQTVS